MKTRRLLLIAISLFSLGFVAKASDVTLSSGDSAFANTNPFAGITDGDTLFIYGKFVMNAHYTRYENTSVVLVLDGSSSVIHWTGNYDLKLGSGSSMIITNGATLTVSGPCNNNKTIYFGSTLVAACTGGDQGVLNFADIVYAGGVDSNGTAVPVSWLSFEAKAINATQVALDWQTASEQNNSHFEVEYSVDGTNWTIAGTQASKSENGFSNGILNYNFTHSLFEHGSYVYYRIRQVDYDGKYDYSEIVTVRFDLANKMTISSLGDNKITVSAKESSNTAQLNIYDMSGRTVFSNTLSNQVISLDEEGIYIIELHDGYSVNRVKHVVH